MKVLMIGVGSTGDILPFVSLSGYLNENGHETVIATHKPFEELVRKSGARFVETTGNPAEIISSDLGRKWISSGESPFDFTKYLKMFIDEFMGSIFNIILKEAEHADFIFYSTLFPMGKEIAQYYNIPYLCVFLQPLMPTTEYPAMLMPKLTGKFPLYNKLSHKITEYFFYNVFSHAINKWRGKALGLGPFSYLQAFGMHSEAHTNYMMPVSDIIMKRPHDWGPHIRKTDNWFYEDTEIDREIEAFLDSGRKTVYMGFGSMHITEKDIIMEAIERIPDELNVNLLLCCGWSGFAEIASPHIMLKKHVNHFRYLTSNDVIVHHGGSGTVSSAFRSGRPQLVMPFFADQFYWADTVVKKGTGLKLPFHNASADDIVQSLKRIMNDRNMYINAQSIALSLEKTNGLQRAMHIMEQMRSRACRQV